MSNLACKKCGGPEATYYYIQDYACWLCFTCSQAAKQASKEDVNLYYAEVPKTV